MLPVLVKPLSASTNMASPKSVTWGTPRKSSRMFDGFRSQCRIPWTCGVVDGSRDLRHDPCHFAGISAQSRQMPLQVAAADELEDQERVAAVLADLVKRYDIRVVKCGNHFGFDAEATNNIIGGISAPSGLSSRRRYG